MRVATYFGLTFCAFLFFQSMDKIHVWMALRRDEKLERIEREEEIKRVRHELLQQQLAKPRD